jgi:hypothetical protein
MYALARMGPAAAAALPALRKLAAERPDSGAGDIVLILEGKEPETYY